MSVSRLFIEGSSCKFESHPKTLQIKNGTRKLFIDDFFSTENKHEIANNYRNSKKRILSRRRKSSVKWLKQNRGDYSRREVFQIPCFVYPRFTEVFPWRGRHSLCKQNPPDGLLNDFVKRIQIATTLDELKTISLYRSKVSKFPIGHQPGHSNRCPYSGGGNQPKEIENIKQSKRVKTIAPTKRILKEKRKLGSIESDESNFRKQSVENWSGFGRSANQQKEYARFVANECSAKTSDNHSQAASDFYDEGLLAHLRYLERIGKRKAASLDDDEVESDGNDFASRFKSVSLYPTSSELRHLSGHSSKKLFTNTVRRVVTLERPILKRNRRPVFRSSAENSNYLSYSQNSEDCRIRVEITSAASRSSSRVHLDARPSSTSTTRLSISTPSEVLIDGNDSMRSFATTSDDNYPIGSFASRIQLNGNRSPDTPARTVDRNDNVSELISSLYRLDIASELGSLPKIVLTDFSSSQGTSATSTPSLIYSTLSSCMVGSTKPVTFVELTDFDRCLNIPSETNYRSEARPP